MTGCGQRGKPKAGFPPLPTSPWKSLARFPHSHSPDHYRHGKVEIQRQDSHFPTATFPYTNIKKNQIRKEIKPGLIPSSSGSSLDWKTLSVAQQRRDGRQHIGID